jgi:hypothetical protein
MTNTYKAISVVGEHHYGEGVVELDLSPDEERDALNSKHLEIVPRKYRILSDNYEAGEQGAVTELVLLKENEAALISGGHIQRLDDGEDGESSTVKEPSADGGQGGKAASKQKKEDSGA